MVNPQYKTITYDSTAAELDLNTWYRNGPTNVNANKIILSGNLTWDIKWQIAVFAKQELVFDGNGYTITLAKDTGGTGTSPEGFSGLFCIGNNSSYSSSIADSNDYYGLYVKKFIIDSEENSIPLKFENNNNGRYNGYVFGHYHDNSLIGWGYNGSPTTNPPGIERVTPDTKNTLICEKVEVKAYFTSDVYRKQWLIYNNSDNYSYSSENSSGAFIGSLHGRAKFINCIANGKFTGYRTTGYIEFVNCLTTNNSYLCGRDIHYHGGQNFYNKYIFENCVSWKLFENIYHTSTHSDITSNGKIIEISGCKVDYSDYWTTNPGISYVLEQNSTKNFDYLDDVSPYQSMRISELDNVLAVIGVEFKKSNNTIILQFSPYPGVDIVDVLAVRNIDLTSTDTVSNSDIPTTWFDNLKGSGETLERNKETRRNNLFETIFTTNSTKTFFDISRNVISMSVDSVQDTYRVFKVSDASANIDLRDLSENIGFYIPLSTDKDKVNVTTRANDITFEIKRDGVDISGNNIYYIEKKSGTANLTIDRDGSINLPILSTTSTTATSTTATSTTATPTPNNNDSYNNSSNSNSGGQTTTNNVCLSVSTNVNVVSSNGNKYVFNNDSSYDSTKKYGLYTTTYTFKDIPEAHPLAILNNGNSNISYTGDANKKFSKSVSGTTSDGTYDFYYGDITATVSGDFNSVSVYCYYHGYMGGENLLEYKYSCSY